MRVKCVCNVKCPKLGILNQGTARKEMLDLEDDICRSHDLSFHLVTLLLYCKTCYYLKFAKDIDYHDMTKKPSLLKKVPFKLKFEPETLHMCTKLSGLAASYSTKEKFDSILHFLSKRFVF